MPVVRKLYEAAEKGTSASFRALHWESVLCAVGVKLRSQPVSVKPLFI